MHDMTQLRTERRIWRIARLSALCALVVALSAWYAVRQASAEFRERSLSIGRHIESLPSAFDPAAGTSTIRLNGQRITLTSVSSDDDVGPILDRFSAMCARNSGGISEELHALVAKGAKIPDHVANGFGVLRAQSSDHEGTAACFARDGGAGLAGLLSRARSFVKTRDLAAFGQLRYVFAHRREPGVPTHVLTVISDGALPIEQMFPSERDAPGDDLVPGVRPEHARRVVSAELEGSRERAVIYETRVPAVRALKAYDAALPTRGYERGDLAPVADALPAQTRVYMKPDDMLLLIAKDLTHERSQVSAFRLANGGFAKVRM